MSAQYDPQHITYFAETDYRSERTRFGIKSRDRTRHMYVIGKSGVGKSTLLENMAIQDIAHGEGVAVLDPHGSFAEKMLEYIPMDRIKDVVYFAPFDASYPISFNVLEDVGADKRHFVASGLMSTFKKIWVDAWSARMEYILNNILLALLEYPGSTLLGVNRMLSDKIYRNKVVDNITDPGVKAFWVEEFAKYGERYMQEAGAAIQNKIGQLTANPLIRNIIGQPKSSFDIRQVMDQQKILIINLSKGRIGEQNTSLLGSMIITKIYLAAMSRAEVPAQQMAQLSNFYFYVDEFQSFANETFADILAEARKYKLALIIAHQYVAQMEEKVRDAVFGNVGTTISFRVGPLDGELLEKVMAPQFTQNDLINLGMAQIYLTLMIDDIGSVPFSARTLPPLQRPTISYRNDVIEYSRETFAFPKETVEDAIRGWYDDGPKDTREGKFEGKREKGEGQGEKKFIPYVPEGLPPVASHPYTPKPEGEQPKKVVAAAPAQYTAKPFQKQRPVSGLKVSATQEEKTHQPFKKAFVTPVAHPQNTTPVTKETPLSDTLSNLLNAIDTDTATAKNVQTFETEKPLKETLPPVKFAERGPTQQNRDLLKAALAKASAPISAVSPSPVPAPAMSHTETTNNSTTSTTNTTYTTNIIHHDAPQTVAQPTPQEVPQPVLQQTPQPTQTHTPPPPIATDTSQQEIAYQDLKKILE